MTPANPDALADALAQVTAENDRLRDDLPTGAELAELMAYEPPHNPPPPALPVRKRFYLTKCPHCQWVGSSEQCGSEPNDDSDAWCPVCHSPGCEADPSLTESEEHGEEVYQRLAAAEARAAQLQAEVEAKDRARWLPIATAPTDRPVVVRMKTDRLQGGWFVATVTLPDPDDDSRFGSCSTIWHYNGDTLLTQFRGTWTEWLDDGGSDRTALAARAATAREGA